ncbi:(2Fe-2S)-binding protein [Sabulicella glaciei]|uniref:2Fe-2S iron-sulfur cluster-binding protein n=1 Tax=Sabulicella glaciei TaxID=2984948 RepID=A0ABT3NQW0_9PROT|nr:2Fe-2S iron-sulfur cluster-binding protein [Roseococcus sp. MDT2-1-1]MCW8084536.1 2Fe-2S iron-sulfur cluster-binding protein [Roseococcus sp. MDT2-1-1]
MNGRPAEHPGGVTLLEALRSDFALSGPRFGCGQEQCGACHVLLNGESVPSCALPVEAAEGREVTTVEGLTPHPLQAAFEAEQAGQCGFCLSGILVSAAALLRRNPGPDEAAIRAALEPHLCRCGVQNRILRAVRRAVA